MIFLPISFTCSLFFTANLCAYVYDLTQDSPPRSEVESGFQGLFKAPVLFFLLYLSPLRIANKYRKTQEVNPSGSVIAVVACVTQILSMIITVII